jgi:hypothetical protein
MSETRVHQEVEEKKRRPLGAIIILIILFLLLAGAIYLFILGRGGLGMPDRLPDPPSNIQADDDPIFDVALWWQDNSDNEEGFRIYRRRLDILDTPALAGSTGANETEFTDEETMCGATYQYTVASFNALGESPATECWEITFPPCPATRVMLLGVGQEYGRNFLTGELGANSDFYLMANDDGSMAFMANLPGQMGILNMGNVGEVPLPSTPLPPNPTYGPSAGAAQGNTYVAMTRNGQALIVFSLSQAGDPAYLEYILYPLTNDFISYGPCQRLGGRTPGGPCVSGDWVCDPTCTPPDPGSIGTPLPDGVTNQPDDMEEHYNPIMAYYSSGALFTPMVAPPATSPIGTPGLPGYPTPTYTETDEDCGNMWCISGDGICNPECATTPGLMGWINRQTCEAGGPDYDTMATTAMAQLPTLCDAQPFQPSSLGGGETGGGQEGGTEGGEQPAAPAMAQMPEGGGEGPSGNYTNPFSMGGTFPGATAERTGLFVDTDCGQLQCITGDGICNPVCTPNYNDTTRIATGGSYGTLPPSEFGSIEGDEQPAAPAMAQLPAIATPTPAPDGSIGTPGLPALSRIDGDCAGPCTPGDGICTPYCSPYFNPYGIPGSDPQTSGFFGALLGGQEGGGQEGGTESGGEQPAAPAMAQMPGEIGSPDTPGGTSSGGGEGGMDYLPGLSHVDFDCGNPCQPGDDPCACTPTTAFAQSFTGMGSLLTCSEHERECWCDGPHLACDDGYFEAYYPECPQSTCGDGYCDTLSENTDICPADCSCVDDGYCLPGEGTNCGDCQTLGGGCGAPCTSSEQCQVVDGVQLSCFDSVCWESCTCGGNCGGGTEGGTTVTCWCETSCARYCSDGSYHFDCTTCP